MRYAPFALFAACALSGCINVLGEYDPDPALTIAAPEREGEAIQIAKTKLGTPVFSTIYWYGPAALTCNDGGFETPIGCMAGFTFNGGSIVAWNGTDPIHATALGHELVHQRFGDLHHKRRDLWGETLGRYDYDAGSVVGDLNALFAAAGM